VKKIPYGRQHIAEEDIQEVVNVLRSERLTQGPAIPAFEKAFARYVNAPYAVAVSNGTAALHLSVLSLGLKPGQKVVTTPLTFAATANCIQYCGGETVFADIDPDTRLLSLANVETLLRSAPKGTFKGIIAVDFAGCPVRMDLFRDLADQYGCWIIEDACHAPGAFFEDRFGETQFCGNGVYADASVFSFHPVKHIAAGEGGMITTAKAPLNEKARMLRTHGIQNDPEKMVEDHGPWYYEMQKLGFNYRLTDIQAALGRSQLQRADEGLARRKVLAERYHAEFAGQPFLAREIHREAGHAYHLFVAEFKNRDGLFRHLRENNIYAQVHYIPLHLMPYYSQLGWQAGDFPAAEAYYRHGLSLPLFPSMSDQEQARVIQSVYDFYDMR